MKMKCMPLPPLAAALLSSLKTKDNLLASKDCKAPLRTRIRGLANRFILLLPQDVASTNLRAIQALQMVVADEHDPWPKAPSNWTYYPVSTSFVLPAWVRSIQSVQ